jgi:excisionase family DNA binding protein
MHTYITPDEAAEMLRVTRRTINAMISDGRLPAYKLGRRVTRLRRDEVEAALRPVD